jgi:hypothetical protein
MRRSELMIAPAEIIGKLRKTELHFAVSHVMLWEENFLFPEEYTQTSVWSLH